MSIRKNNKIKVSFIVPFYNGEKYANECIRSISGQLYENIEIILVNDGSTDGTLKILEQFALEDKRIQIVDKKNEGVSVARNTAMNLATGDYICFVDQDDTIDPDYTTYFLGIIEKSDIALTPKTYKLTENSKKKRIDNNNDSVVICKGEKAAEKMLYYDFVIAPWNKIISRELIEKNKIVFKDGFFSGEGFMFSIECFLAAKSVSVGTRKVYNYRVDNANSGMTKFTTRIVESSMLAQKMLRELVSIKAPKLLKACKYAKWHTATDCYNMMVGCKVVKKYPEMFKKLKKICREDALSGLTAPISVKEKIKCMSYFICPMVTAKIINKMRLRKFTIDE